MTRFVHNSVVELVDFMGTDLTVVNVARVSFAKESFELNEKDERLIAYLAKHGHWSPFAHCFVQLRIKAPIFVARQLVKHQIGLSWNEVSRRYVDSEPEVYMPLQWRGKAANVKQGSSDVPIDINIYYGNCGSAGSEDPYHSSVDIAMETYETLLGRGVCPEQARMVLPQSMMTEWIWSGSLMAFARVCKQRLDPHAQAETRDVAAMIDKQCESLYPISWKALKEN
jgi:thymidylate synthase (FAD)